MKGYIYKITNLINGKIYIGQTIQQIEKRWQSHFCRISKPDGVLGKAINKYGKSNFKKEILETIYNEKRKSLVEQLNINEIYYIGFYKSSERKFGYNFKKGGDNNLKFSHSDLSKQMMSVNKKALMNELKRKHYSDAKKGSKNTMYGKSGTSSPVAKPVSQYTKTGEWIADFISATEASKILGISQKNISTCCTGLLKSSGGFIWKHKID